MEDEEDDFGETPLDFQRVHGRAGQAENFEVDSDSDDVEEDLEGADEAPEFFDPESDEKDAAWVAKQRQGRKSDAILSCPCCLTTLCIDCQQHADLEGQFRAMFVMNCRVLLDKVVEATCTDKQKKRKRNRGSKEEVKAAAREEVYHSVECEVCQTEVGARDQDEVFHFFHVAATNA